MNCNLVENSERRQVILSGMKSYLEEIVPPKVKRIKKEKKERIARPRIPYYVQVRVIELRYGKPGTVDHTIHTHQFIAEVLKLNLNSVLSICYRYRDRNCHLPLKKPYAKEKKQHFTKDQERELVSMQNLD